MGPSVKFVLAIIDSISKKKMGVNFFPTKLDTKGGGHSGLNWGVRPSYQIHQILSRTRCMISTDLFAESPATVSSVQTSCTLWSINLRVLIYQITSHLHAQMMYKGRNAVYFIYVTAVIFISLNSAISKYAVIITLKEIIFHFWQKMLLVPASLLSFLSFWHNSSVFYPL